MKQVVLFLFVFFSVSIVGQNRPKYILVPVHFTFSKGENPYNLSSLTKSYFQKEGFEVYLENEELPQELAINRCLAWRVELKEESSFLLTKMTVELNDCYGKLITASKEGKSREKERRIGYSEAFREAVKTLQIPKELGQLSYMMIPADDKKSPETGSSNSKPQIEKPQADFPILQNNLNTPTQEKKELLSSSIHDTVIPETFYAQPNVKGYQLVDSTPRIVLFLMKTSKEDIYIGVRNQIRGVVYVRNNQWVFEYYQDDTLVTEILRIKF
jgi:hypothetical protein